MTDTRDPAEQPAGDPAEQPAGDPAEAPIFRGFSEFGELLADFIATTPSIRGAILTDDKGDPIDFTHRHALLSALDAQIAGAQVEQTTLRIQAWCARHGLGSCEILVEASHGMLLSGAPQQDCVLSCLHTRHEGDDDDPELLLTRFAALRRQIAELLR
ncbi:MAG: hypothetical protein H0T76_22960 [Nannocystis sp.]|nr:hypothetical protein [Nannocystis sp.]MBA3549344.1 hypothetical protein [Nannocystis sp.]